MVVNIIYTIRGVEDAGNLCVDLPAIPRVGDSLNLQYSFVGEKIFLKAKVSSVEWQLVVEDEQSKSHWSVDLYIVEKEEKGLLRIGWSKRTKTILVRANITTWDILCSYSVRELLLLPDCGRKTIIEIVAVLESKGLGLKKEV